MPKPFANLIEKKMLGPDNLFIHMTAMPDSAWQAAKDAGAGL
jgi:5-methylthioadenosine/S-adenosylhomocysteine deaminase